MRLVGELIRLHKVEPTQRDGIHIELAGDSIHQAFDDIGRLGAARAAICVNRCGVGRDQVDFHIHRTDLVVAGDIAGRVDGGNTGRHIG